MLSKARVFLSIWGSLFLAFPVYAEELGVGVFSNSATNLRSGYHFDYRGYAVESNWGVFGADHFFFLQVAPEAIAQSKQSRLFGFDGCDVTTQVGQRGRAGYGVRFPPFEVGGGVSVTNGERFNVQFDEQRYYINRNIYQGALQVEVESAPWYGPEVFAGIGDNFFGFSLKARLALTFGQPQSHTLRSFSGLNLTDDDILWLKKRIEIYDIWTESLFIQVLYQF